MGKKKSVSWSMCQDLSTSENCNLTAPQNVTGKYQSEMLLGASKASGKKKKKSENIN